MGARLKALYRRLGRIEKTFLVLFALSVLLSYWAPSNAIQVLVLIATWITGFVAALRLARTGMRKLIWSLRNRLIVAYLFIAMVPVALILALMAVSTYALTAQIALYLVNAELDRRTSALRGAADAIAHAPPERRRDVVARMESFLQTMFPVTEVLVLDGGEYR